MTHAKIRNMCIALGAVVQAMSACVATAEQASHKSVVFSTVQNIKKEAIQPLKPRELKNIRGTTFRYGAQQSITRDWMLPVAGALEISIPQDESFFITFPTTTTQPPE